MEVPHKADLDHFKDGLTVSDLVRRHLDARWNRIVSRQVKDGPSEFFGLAVVTNRALFSVNPDGAHFQSLRDEGDLPVSEWI